MLYFFSLMEKESTQQYFILRNISKLCFFRMFMNYAMFCRFSELKELQDFEG